MQLHWNPHDPVGPALALNPRRLQRPCSIKKLRMRDSNFTEMQRKRTEARAGSKDGGDLPAHSSHLISSRQLAKLKLEQNYCVQTVILS